MGIGMSTSSGTDDAQKPVRVLCIDGGGVRGIIPVTILLELKKRTGKEPRELFDLICGTSTGGIIALLVGALRYDIQECYESYKSLSTEIFPPRGLLKDIVDGVETLYTKEFYDHKKLENLVREKVAQKVGDRDALLSHPQVAACDASDGSTRVPRACVFSTCTSGPKLYAFRNYPTDSADLFGTSEVKVWEAVRATSAAPPYFDPMTIRDVVYSDGGLLANNPVMAAHLELQDIAEFRKRKVVILSLGTGAARSDSKSKYSGSIWSTLNLLADCATQSDETDRQFRRFAKNQPESELYYERLNPQLSVEYGLDDSSKLSAMEKETDEYLAMADTELKLDAIIKQILL